MRWQTKKEKELKEKEKEKQEQQTGEYEQAQKNKPTAREREEHDATHMPFRDWCTHCMMGRRRTHHHVSKKRSEELSRRPIIAMEYSFLKPNSIANSQTTAGE